MKRKTGWLQRRTIRMIARGTLKPSEQDVLLLAEQAVLREIQVEELQRKLRIAQARVAELESTMSTTGRARVPSCLTELGQPILAFSMPSLVPPCVYFLFKHYRLIYVGQSRDLLGRLHGHFGKGAGKDFDEVFYLPVAQEDLDRVEREMIMRFHPPQNHCRWSRMSLPVASTV